METSSPNGNMVLWDSVCTTDPRFAKKQTFGAKLTAVNAQSQLRRATELWGPYGGEAGWGLRNLRFDLIRAPGGDTATPETIQAIAVVAEFYWPGGAFEIAADIPYSPRDDCYKKVLTAARSKALLTLGFNADIPLKEFQEGRPAGREGPPPQQRGNGNGNNADLQRAKANALRDVTTRLAAVGSSLAAIGLIRSAAKAELGHDIIQTREELEWVHKAICTGQYNLTTGKRKEPAPNGQL